MREAVSDEREITTPYATVNFEKHKRPEYSQKLSVAQWLRSIGLPQYTSTFKMHQIDIPQLLRISESSLRAMRIPEADRRKILHAAQELAEQS